MSGRRVDTAGGEEFAVDATRSTLTTPVTALIFCSRCDTEVQTPLLLDHFADWGMEVHA